MKGCSRWQTKRSEGRARSIRQCGSILLATTHGRTRRCHDLRYEPLGRFRRSIYASISFRARLSQTQYRTATEDLVRQFPPQAELAEDLDLKLCAQQFELTGARSRMWSCRPHSSQPKPMERVKFAHILTVFVASYSRAVAWPRSRSEIMANGRIRTAAESSPNSAHLSGTSFSGGVFSGTCSRLARLYRQSVLWLIGSSETQNGPCE